MNISVKVDEKFVAEVIEEYCTNHACPKGCPFDAIGACTQNNPFNTVFDRYKQLKAGDNEYEEN